MEKALEILKSIKTQIITLTETPNLDEAIAELEETMKPKTCEGCKYYSPYRQQECLHEKYCQREFTDYHEPKDNA